MNRLPGVREPDDRYRLDEREAVYEGKIFRVFRERITLPNGVETVHEVLDYPAAVSIIPVLEESPGVKEIVLVEQFRNALRGSIHEIPAGMLEPDEDPLTCARRELAEETGYGAERWTHVTTMHPTPGISASTMVYFLAEGLHVVGPQKLDATECLTVRRVALDALIDFHVHGKAIDGVPSIVDGKTHVAIYYLAARAGASR